MTHFDNLELQANSGPVPSDDNLAQILSFNRFPTDSHQSPAPHPNNPIRRHVFGISDVIELTKNVPRSQILEQTGRTDRWYGITLDGYRQGVRITDPTPSQDIGVTVALLPGYMETIEGGAAKEMHDTLAYLMPELRVISFATDGVGDVVERLHVGNVRDHSFEAMAEQRHKLLLALCGEQPILATGTSMGSVLALLTLAVDKRKGQELRISPIYFASAIVPPENIARDMAGWFLPSVAIENPGAVIEKFALHSLRNIRGFVRNPFAVPHNALALSNNLYDLLRGVSAASVQNIANSYGGTVASGSRDPLAQKPMWRHIAQQTGNLSLEFYPGEGHGIAGRGKKAGRMLAETIRKFGIIEQALRSA